MIWRGILGTIALALTATAATPSLALVVLNKADNALAIVDPSTNKVVALVPTGVAPHEVVVSDDGKLAFVSNYGSDEPGHTISVIDLQAQREIRRVDTGALGRPHGLAFVEGKLYFTAEMNRKIARYDPASNKIDWTFPTNQDITHMLLFNRERNLVFTSNLGSNTVTVIDRMEGKATQIPVGTAPEGIDISPDGKEVWVAHGLDGGVSIIDVATKRVTLRIDLFTKRSNRLKFTPDGTRVLISDDTGGTLVIVDAKTREEVTRVNVGRGPEGILMFPDGSRAYVALSRDDKVAIFDLKTLKVTGSFSTGRSPDGMAWAVRK